MHHKKAKKFEEKKALIHLSPFSRKGISYNCDSWPLCAFSALCNLPRKKKSFNDFFEKHFSQFSIFEVFCKGHKFPSLEGDLFVTFDHIELTRFPNCCGYYLTSVFLTPCVFLETFIWSKSTFLP